MCDSISYIITGKPSIGKRKLRRSLEENHQCDFVDVTAACKELCPEDLGLILGVS